MAIESFSRMNCSVAKTMSFLGERWTVLVMRELFFGNRRFDTMAMGVATDGLNRLFSNESDVLRLMRDVGLGLVDRMPALKSFFIREAAGVTGDVPKLLRGEAL